MSQFITDEVYAKWVEQWQELQHDKKPFDFFRQTDKLLLGDFFDAGDMETLVSTAGIATVKVRFGFEKEKNEFKLILFGVDSAGEMITPYYAHTPADFREVGGGVGGNVPDVLAIQWKKYWSDLGFAGELTSAQFRTHYGFLNGYNYPAKELIHALFGFKDMPRIYISFVLHKYFPFSSDSSKASELGPVFTFGLLFQAIENVSLPDGKLDDGDGKGGYYDLSAPCPRTC